MNKKKPKKRKQSNTKSKRKRLKDKTGKGDYLPSDILEDDFAGFGGIK